MHALILIVSYTLFVAAPLAMLPVKQAAYSELDDNKSTLKISRRTYRYAVTAVGMLVTVVISYVG